MADRDVAEAMSSAIEAALDRARVDTALRTELAAANARIAALTSGDVLPVPRDLLESLVDRDPCWFDHDGGCQGHGYISLSLGEKCPQRQLKDLLGA